MAEQFSFFDPALLENGTYDREYNAQDFTDYFNTLITTGVMKGVGNMLAVSANGLNMITKINTGVAFVEAKYYKNDSFREHTHDTETLGNSRIDRIVVRMDLSTDKRHVLSFIKKGAPSPNPIPPALTQTTNIYEISLAQVRVVGGQTFIATNAITDERGTNVICPWAGSNILPSFDDNALAKHLADDARHLKNGERDKINNALPKTGGTLTGDLTIEKGIPRFRLKPSLIPADDNKIFDIFYNAAGGNNFGVMFTKDGNHLLQLLGQKDVRFLGHDDAWMSLADLKSSVSNGKAQVANAITQKGVTTSPTAEFATIASNIAKISTGKKYAEGTAISVTNRPSYVASWIKLTGLGFIPRAVIAKRVGTANTEWFSVYGWMPSIGNDLKIYRTNGAVFNSNGSGGNVSEFWVQTDDNGGIAYEYITYE